jgi:DNA-binding MarR family transcriptional regulator
LDIVREIGCHQEAGQPLTLKDLYTLRLGSVATVQRRLSQLKRLGVVAQDRIDRDRRSYALLLSPSALKAYARYISLIRALGATAAEKVARAQRRDPRRA